jgi:hypothetical protein
VTASRILAETRCLSRGATVSAAGEAGGVGLHAFSGTLRAAMSAVRTTCSFSQAPPGGHMFRLTDPLYARFCRNWRRESVYIEAFGKQTHWNEASRAGPCTFGRDMRLKGAFARCGARKARDRGADLYAESDWSWRKLASYALHELKAIDACSHGVWSMTRNSEPPVPSASQRCALPPGGAGTGIRSLSIE